MIRNERLKSMESEGGGNKEREIRENGSKCVKISGTKVEEFRENEGRKRWKAMGGEVRGGE